MKRPPRWLQILGILAVGFVVGRFTAGQPEQVGPVGEPLIADDVPVEVEFAEPTSIAVSDVPVHADVGPLDAPLIVDPAGESGVEEPAEPSRERSASTVIADAMAEGSVFVGTWHAETSHGPRIALLNADGSGTIDAKLDWVAALLYGSRLTFQVDWLVDLEEKRMVHAVKSGTPKDNVAAVTRDFGAVKEYIIREYSENQMVLVDPGDGEVITWNRCEPGTTLD